MTRACAIVLTCAGIGLVLGGCSSTQMFKSRDQLVTTSSPCAAKRFEIYFADGEARLTDPARQAIGLTAAQLQGCTIRSVKVLGLADARGGAEANLDLSQRRAQAVAAALTSAGWPVPAFDVDAAGDEGAADASGVREPLRRRTEVLVDAIPG